MIRDALEVFARDANGDVMLKTLRIPFRPEYILVPKPGTNSLPEMVPLTESSGFLKSFQFHLSVDAIELIMEQDPHVTPQMGYSKLTIVFDAAESGLAMIEATRGVRQWELEKAPT